MKRPRISAATADTLDRAGAPFAYRVTAVDRNGNELPAAPGMCFVRLRSAGGSLASRSITVVR